MENKDWRNNLERIVGKSNIETMDWMFSELVDLIEEEKDKAREEGYEEGRKEQMELNMKALADMSRELFKLKDNK
jgi:hypothetical protein